MTPHVLLLFVTPEIFLGELVTRAGAYDHLALTDAGEARLNAHVSDWQQQGNDETFQQTFQDWCDTQHIHVIALKSHLHADCGHTLLTLPFTADERFSMIKELSQANADALIAWHHFLTRAQDIVTSGHS